MSTYKDNKKERTGYSMKNKRIDNSGPNRIDTELETAPAAYAKMEQRHRRMQSRVGRLRRNSVTGALMALLILRVQSLLRQ